MTDTRYSAYQQASATSWARIDMLLALYDATLFALEHGQAAVQSNDQAALLKYRFRSQRLISELMGGVDREQGELPGNVYRLLMFALMQTSGTTEEAWASAIAVISQLQTAFREIRDQAVQLERNGQIPPLGANASEEMLAVG